MKKIMEKYKIQFKEVLNDLRTPERRYRQIPNILTGSRLLSPFVIIPSVITGNFALAGISTALFAMTDLFDGLVARKLEITSEFGKDLDAFTDKLFVGTLLISLVITNPFYAMPLLMEIAIAGINVNKKINNQKAESHMIGKVKMTSLYTLIALGYMNMYVKVPPELLNTLFVSTIGLQTAAVVSYSKNDNKINTDVIEAEKVNNKEVENLITEEEHKEKTKEKEETLTAKYLKQYRQLRNEALSEKIMDEQEIKTDESVKVNVKK